MFLNAALHNDVLLSSNALPAMEIHMYEKVKATRHYSNEVDMRESSLKVAIIHQEFNTCSILPSE